MGQLNLESGAGLNSGPLPGNCKPPPRVPVPSSVCSLVLGRPAGRRSRTHRWKALGNQKVPLRSEEAPMKGGPLAGVGGKQQG